MEILLALLISTAIVRDDVQLDIASLNETQMTRASLTSDDKPTE